MMNEWSKEQLEEMFGDDVVEQLAFLAGCTKHRLANDPVIPDGWIVPDEVLKKFAELIVRECISLIEPDKEHREDASWGYIGGEEGVELLDGCARRIKEHFGVEE